MSEENEPSPEVTPDQPSDEPAPRARKATKSRARKTAKSAVKSDQPTKEVPADAPLEPLVENTEPATREEPPETGGDWAEADEESGDGDRSGGGQGQNESGKRKRRRRKGKGQSSQGQGGGEEVQQSESKVAETNREQGPRQDPRSQPQRARVDPEHHAKMAWKIYLAEVSEEGVALIGDNDAKDLARRCFRLAEIFLEEQGRRR